MNQINEDNFARLVQDPIVIAPEVKTDILRAIKLQAEIKRRFIEARDVYNEEHISPEHKQRAMDMATTFQGVLDAMGVEYD